MSSAKWRPFCFGLNVLTMNQYQTRCFLWVFMARGPQNETYSIPASQYQDVCDTLGAGLLSEQVVHSHIIKMYWLIPFSLVTQ